MIKNHNRHIIIAVVIVCLLTGTIALADSAESKDNKSPGKEVRLVSFGGGMVEVDYEQYLGQHDVVYLSPPAGGWEGMPIGNGDMAAMVWTEPKELIWAVNKCDLWDDGGGETGRTCLRSAGRLTISNSLPSYDLLYLSDYHARLDLHKATVLLDSTSPFSKVKTETFVDYASRCLVVDYEDQTEEQVPRVVSISRWGSRIFARWYVKILREPQRGLEGTEVQLQGDVAVIKQQTRSLKFAVACRVLTESEGAWQRCNSRELAFRVAPTRKCHLKVLVSVATSEEAEDPVAHVVRAVRQASQKGIPHLRVQHQRRWREFWAKSFIDIPDKYLENLWYLNLYVLGSSSLGRYPPNNNSGLWIWNHDIRPWNDYWHWNNQYLNWPVYAAGHPELAKAYLKMRFDGLESAKDRARRVYNSSGAFYSDNFGRRGCTGGRKHLLTAGAQVALDCWRHYRYTGDEIFLREIGYPVMTAACQLYLDLLKKGEDRLYHLPASHPYEHPLGFLVRDCITDLSAIRALFPVTAETAMKMGETDFAERINEVVANLVGHHIMDLPDCYISRDGERLLFNGGGAHGRTIEDAHMLCVGFRVPDGLAIHYQLWRDPNFGYKTEDYTLFATAQDAPIFPHGVVGLKDRDTELFSAAKTTTLCNWIKSLGLSILPISFARLGMGQEAQEAMSEMVNLYQQFPQGFGTEYPIRSKASPKLLEDMKRGLMYNNREQWRKDYGYDWPVGLVLAPSIASMDRGNIVRIINSEGEWVWLFSIPLTHFLQTPICVVQTAISEMLLQSYDEVIRVAPAVPPDWDVTFAHWAQGGFRVTARVNQGRVAFVSIEAGRDGICRVENPWSCLGLEAELMNKDTGAYLKGTQTGDIYEFMAKGGKRYLLLPSNEAGVPRVFRPTVEGKRTQPRFGHGRFIGIQRRF